MKSLKGWWLFFVMATSAPAITVTLAEVVTVTSLMGMDVDADIEGVGEGLSVQLVNRPMAIGFALPESLIEAVQAPMRLAKIGFYDVAESNLIPLSGISLSCVLKEKAFYVEVDVSKMKQNPDQGLTAHQLVQLTVMAIQQTLEKNGFGPSKEEHAMPVMISIIGTTEENSALKNLGVQWNTGK